MKIRFTYVRHGQTLFNRTARMQGRCDSPLSEEGIRQAENTASALRNEHFDHIFCSSSERAWDTAKIIAQYHQEEPVCLKELKEFDFGTLDGQLFSEMNDIIQAHRKADDWTDVGGENVPLFEKRAEKAFEKILSSCKDGDHVLLVSHGSYFSHLLKTILNYDFEDYRLRMNAINRPLVPNCSAAEFEYEDGQFRVLSEPLTADEYRARRQKEISMVFVTPAETVFAGERRKEGQCDSPLTEKGVKETEDLADRLSTFSFDQAFVSTSERARDTAEILLKDHPVLITYERKLREQYYGLLEGDNLIDPEEIIHYEDHGGESEKDLLYRALEMIRMIFDTSLCKDELLVVTHPGIRKKFMDLFAMTDAKIMENEGFTVVRGFDSSSFERMRIG